MNVIHNNWNDEVEKKNKKKKNYVPFLLIPRHKKAK